MNIINDGLEILSRINEKVVTVQVATKTQRHKGQVWLLPPYLKSLPVIARSGEAGGGERIARKSIKKNSLILVP